MPEYTKVFAHWFDWYEEPQGNWLTCNKCGYKPRVWVFDNGRYAQCACAKEYSRYKKRNIEAENIMEHIRRTNGSVVDYDSDELRKNWNSYVRGVD